MDINVAFGITLRKLRLSSGLTQEQLGFESGLRRTFISSLELAENEPSLQTIQKLALALNLPLSKLMLEVEKEQKRGVNLGAKFAGKALTNKKGGF
jgi:transcriptional regulator with XRE-family HTH domain